MKIPSPKPQPDYKVRRYLGIPVSRGAFLFSLSIQVLIVSCLLFVQVQSAESQQALLAPIPPGTTAVTAQPLTVFITARGQDGAPADLSNADIGIKADGKPANVIEVHRVVGIPMTYCLLIDTSSSQKGGRLRLEQDEATQLVTQVVKAGRDRGTLVSFNESAYVDAEGSNPREFVSAIEKEQAMGGTAMFQAIFGCASRMLKDAPDNNLRVMFILSDGEDNLSRVNRDAAVTTVLKAGMRVYAIGQYGESRLGLKTLTLFAEATGGRTYFPSKQKDIGKAITDIADELSSILAVTFTVPGEMHDGRLHQLEAKCSKNGVSVTAPELYYAPQP